MLLKETLLLRFVGVSRIPILLALRPRVQRLDEDVCELLVPLTYFSKNHVGSMYIGALASGADCTGGLHAARAIYGIGGRGHPRVVPVFKTFHAEFHKRADGDVLFRSEGGRTVAAAVAKADESGERINLPLSVVATVPARHGEVPVATFTLELSLRRKPDDHRRVPNKV